VVGRSLVQEPIDGSCGWKRSPFFVVQLPFNFVFVAGEDVFSLCFRLLTFSVVGEETLVSVFHGSSYVSCGGKGIVSVFQLPSDVSCGWRLSLCSRYILMFPMAIEVSL
jgi:hypothetical protein